MIESAEILNDQAIQLAQSGSVKEALACLTRAITIENDNYLLWFNLGITCRDAGKLSEARKALEKAYLIFDKDEDVIETLALVCYDMGEFEDALSYCRKGLDYNSQNPHLWNTAGVVRFNQKEYSEASEAFEMAIMLNPYYYDALYNLRDAYKELNNQFGIVEVEKKMREIQN